MPDHDDVRCKRESACSWPSPLAPFDQQNALERPSGVVRAVVVLGRIVDRGRRRRGAPLATFGSLVCFGFFLSALFSVCILRLITLDYV